MTQREREQLMVVLDRVDRLIQKVDQLDARLVKQEHWRTYLIGAGSVLGGLIGWLVGQLGH